MKFGFRWIGFKWTVAGSERELLNKNFDYLIKRYRTMALRNSESPEETEMLENDDKMILLMLVNLYLDGNGHDVAKFANDLALLAEKSQDQ